MNIQLNNTGKKYISEWIFRKMDYSFTTGTHYAVTGPNGSGKSTLLQVLSGFLTPTEGEAIFKENDKLISPAEVYKKVGYAAPGIEVIEEFTLQEAIDFHYRFKTYPPGMDEKNLLEVLGFTKSARNKLIRHFSSGMKQRLKLAFAIIADTPLVLLDEPTITLDRQGVLWYNKLLDNYADNSRLLIIASNIPEDYSRCTQVIDITKYK